jgi:hypothetical protein
MGDELELILMVELAVGLDLEPYLQELKQPAVQQSQLSLSSVELSTWVVHDC